MRYLAAFLPLFLFACTATPEEPRSVRVSGEGKIRVMPDLVILTLEVSFVKPRMADAVKETQQTVDSVMMILEQFGRKNSDIKTSSISANKEYSYAGNRPVFTGFKAQQSIDFVLNDIEQFTRLTGRLLETKISSISQLQFGHSKADSLFREADLLAYDDALQSATKLCKIAGVGMGNLLSLSNTEMATGDQQEGYATGERINTYSKAYGGRGFRISPEVLEFRRTVVSEYEIGK